jgi:hypothetical protein
MSPKKGNRIGGINLRKVKQEDSRSTARPPSGDDFFRAKLAEAGINIDQQPPHQDKLEQELVICREILAQAQLAINIGQLRMDRATFKPSIFLFPFPYFHAETGQLELRIWSLDSSEMTVHPETILAEIRRLSYFPMLDAAEKAPQQLNFANMVNLTKALAFYMQDLIERPEKTTQTESYIGLVEQEIDFLAAAEIIQQADFLPGNGNEPCQSFRVGKKRIIIDKNALIAFKNNLVEILCTEMRDRVERRKRREEKQNEVRDLLSEYLREEED